MPKRALMDQGVECHQLGKCDPLQWPSDCQAVFQPCEAGYINPRKLILAQQKLKGDSRNISIYELATIREAVACSR